MQGQRPTTEGAGTMHSYQVAMIIGNSDGREAETLTTVEATDHRNAMQSFFANSLHPRVVTQRQIHAAMVGDNGTNQDSNHGLHYTVDGVEYVVTDMDIVTTNRRTVETIRAEYTATRERFHAGRPHLHRKVTELAAELAAAAPARYDIVLILESGAQSTTEFPVDEISQANVNRALRHADELVAANPGSTLYSVLAARDAQPSDAEILARATGASGATVIRQRRNEDGTLTETGRESYTARAGCTLGAPEFAEGDAVNYHAELSSEWRSGTVKAVSIGLQAVVITMPDGRDDAALLRNVHKIDATADDYAGDASAWVPDPPTEHGAEDDPEAGSMDNQTASVLGGIVAIGALITWLATAWLPILLGI